MFGLSTELNLTTVKRVWRADVSSALYQSDNKGLVLITLTLESLYWGQITLSTLL